MTQLSCGINSTNFLGHTIPELLEMGCDRHENPQALNEWSNRQWQPLSNQQFQQQVEALAIGLLSLDLQKGDRLAMLMHSDLAFARVDLASLAAGLVNVPIDLTQTIENILYCLNHSEAKALVISELKLLYQILPYLDQAKFLQTIIVVTIPANWAENCEQLLAEAGGSEERSLAPNTCLQIPQILCGDKIDCSELASISLPRCINLRSLAELQTKGQESWSSEAIQSLKKDLAATDLATIIYIASETERPKGVMLSHENMASNALSAFGSYPDLQAGTAETVLLFLPLTHIFARVFLYGHLAYSHSIYLSNPNHLLRHLRTVNPTILISVPRLLEKIYERITTKRDLFDTKGLKNQIKSTAFKQAMRLAHGYDVAAPPTGLALVQWQLSERWVFSQWQDIFGTRLHSLICGGAALRPELVNFFNGSGIPVIQGYGLTETSGVVCYNRKNHHQADTVGCPMPLAEIKIAEDQEILVKAPFVMQGYYKDPTATAEAISQDGWLHTGDIGRLTADGFLQIQGVKKAQFKLSTGKYVSLKPLEKALNQSKLVEWAIAVGMNQKFCGMLIFPDRIALTTLLATKNITYDLDDLNIIALYQNLVDQANCHLPYWSNIRKFALIEKEIPPSFINPDNTLSRHKVYLRFAQEIDQLYRQKSPSSESTTEATTDLFTPQSCPTYAQSLMHS
ncbi:MAG: AMP-binding protein [Limnothrix sp.]